MNRRNVIKYMSTGLAGLPLSGLPTAGGQPPRRALRIAHLTDVHMQPLIGAARGFEKCLHHAQNLPIKPDLIINGGDAVMDAHSRPTHKVRRQWDLFRSVLKNENSLPVLSCIGNHDIQCLEETVPAFGAGRQWAMDELEMTQRYYSLDRNGWHLVVLDSVQPRANGSWYTAFLDEEQFDWLRRDLKATPAHVPILIVSHVPILAACVFFDGHPFKDEHWAIPASWMHSDARQLIDLFHRHPNVKAALSGHIHLRDRVDYDGVTYWCNGAVSGAWWHGRYHHTPAGYAVVDLFEDGLVTNTYVNYRRPS